jgi:hypothetical protein
MRTSRYGADHRHYFRQQIEGTHAKPNSLFAPPHANPTSLFACIGLLGLTQVAAAQCDPATIANGPRAGSDGFINAMTRWDPDGPGPLPEHVVVAGKFTEIANVRSGGIALYNEATDTWSNLADVDRQVCCLQVAANGDLIVGGNFSTVNGVTAYGIANFDGSNWQAIGGGITAQPFQFFSVDAVTTMNNGDVVIGGSFTQVGTTPAQGMARWNGTTWSSLGSLNLGAINGVVQDLVTMPSGDLIACGVFTSAGGVLATNIARWDGSSWHAMGTNIPFPAGVASAMEVMANGDLVCAGWFTSIAGTTSNSIATWNGTSWSASISAPSGSGIQALAILANGDLVAAGGFPSGSSMIWNGSQWQPLGSAVLNAIEAVIPLTNGDILAGGTFERMAPVNSPSPGAGGLARWNGQAWLPEPVGTDGPVSDVLARNNGDYIVVGEFSSFTDTIAEGFAFHDGTSWQGHAFGTNTSQFDSADELQNGGVILVSGAPLHGILRWPGPQGYAYLGRATGPAMAVVDANDDVIVGGSFTHMWLGNQPFATSLAKYHSNTGGWTDIDPNFQGTVTAMAALPDGGVVVAGTLTTTTGTHGHLAIWDGASWNTLNGNVNAIPTDVTVLTNGDIAVVGPFTQAGAIAADGVAIWNGSNWQAAGTGFQVGLASEQPLSCAAMPDGGLLVGGEFTTAGNTSAQNLAFWRGGNWNAVPTSVDGAVTSLDIADNGNIILGGTFLNVGGQPSAYAAQLEPICPAPITVLGSACTQAGATLDLQATTGAWLGSSMNATASNLPANSIALAVYGLTTANVPLSVFGIPTGNCTLHVSPDFLLTAQPTGTIANTTLAIPASASLVGQTVHHQVLSFEIGTPSGIASIGSTQGFSATIGSIW